MKRSNKGSYVLCFAVGLLVNCLIYVNLRSVEDALRDNVDKITVEYIFLNEEMENGRQVLQKRSKWLLVKDEETIKRMKQLFSKKKASFPMKISDGEIKYYNKDKVICKAMFYLQPKYNCAAVRVSNNDCFCALSENGRSLLLKYQKEVMMSAGFQESDTLILIK